MRLATHTNAADVEIYDDHGEAVRTSDLWANRPVALFFVRHFG